MLRQRNEVYLNDDGLSVCQVLHAFQKRYSDDEDFPDA